MLFWKHKLEKCAYAQVDDGDITYLLRVFTWSSFIRKIGVNTPLLAVGLFIMGGKFPGWKI